MIRPLPDMHALMHTFHSRLLPAMLYGVDLTVHVAKFDKLRNGLSSPVVGPLWCASGTPGSLIGHSRSVVHIGLDSCHCHRVQADPRQWQEHEIIVFAEGDSITWAAAVAPQEIACCLRPLRAELPSELLTSKQRKARLHQHHQLLIQPAVKALEMKIWSKTARVQTRWCAYSEAMAQLAVMASVLPNGRPSPNSVHGASAPGPTLPTLSVT
eukprot:s2122_g7.t1